jgi:hypothetical protein
LRRFRPSAVECIPDRTQASLFPWLHVRRFVYAVGPEINGFGYRQLQSWRNRLQSISTQQSEVAATSRGLAVLFSRRIKRLETYCPKTLWSNQWVVMSSGTLSWDRYSAAFLRRAPTAGEPCGCGCELLSSRRTLVGCR